MYLMPRVLEAMGADINPGVQHGHFRVREGAGASAPLLPALGERAGLSLPEPNGATIPSRRPAPLARPPDPAGALEVGIPTT
jgi:hypothetical protein